MQEMQDVAEVDDRTFANHIRQRFMTQEMGARKTFHATCPCCGIVFGIDHSTAEKSMLAKTDVDLMIRTRTALQEYFRDAWKWGLNKTGRFWDAAKKKDAPHRKQRISSPSIDAVYCTGVGHPLRRVYKRAERLRHRLWFSVLWHDAPVIGEMFFACKLGDLFSVLQAIADDAPEFAYRLRQAADNALKRDHSSPWSWRDDDPALEAGQGGFEPFESGSAIDV